MGKNSGEYEYGTTVAFSLIVRAEKIDVENLITIIPVHNYTVIRKGEKGSKVCAPAENDCYYFKIKGKQNDNIEQVECVEKAYSTFATICIRNSKGYTKIDARQF